MNYHVRNIGGYVFHIVQYGLEIYDVSLLVQEDCTACNGTGQVTLEGQQPSRCTYCAGDGYFERLQHLGALQCPSWEVEDELWGYVLDLGTRVTPPDTPTPGAKHP